MSFNASGFNSYVNNDFYAFANKFAYSCMELDSLDITAQVSYGSVMNVTVKATIVHDNGGRYESERVFKQRFKPVFEDMLAEYDEDEEIERINYNFYLNFYER